MTGEAAIAYTLEREKLLRALAARLRVSVDELPRRVEALATRNGGPRRARIAAETLAGAVRTAPSGQRYLITENPGIEPADLAAEARRLSAELDAVVVILLPDARAAALRVGVSVPAAATGRLDARTVLKQVLAVTGGRGGGSRARLASAASRPGPADRAAPRQHSGRGARPGRRAVGPPGIPGPTASRRHGRLAG